MVKTNLGVTLFEFNVPTVSSIGIILPALADFEAFIKVLRGSRASSRVREAAREEEDA